MFMKRTLCAAAMASLALAQPAFADDASVAETRLGESLARWERAGRALESTQFEIGEAEARVESARIADEAARNALADIAEARYKSAPNALEWVLGADSLSDAIARIDCLARLGEDASRRVEEAKLSKANLDRELGSLAELEAEQRLAVESLEAEVAANRSEYDAAVERAAREARAAAAEAAITAQPVSAPQSAETGSDEEPQVREAPREYEPPQSVPSPSGGGLSAAWGMIGVPYVWGASSASGVDCSGLACYCYGYGRGRTTWDMIASLQATGSWKTDIGQLSPGDLVFTEPGHVGIYIGGNQMIHAPQPGSAVGVSAVWSFYGGGSY